MLVAVMYHNPSEDGKLTGFIRSLPLVYSSSSTVQCVRQHANVDKVFLDCEFQKQFAYICSLLYTIHSVTGSKEIPYAGEMPIHISKLRNRTDKKFHFPPFAKIQQLENSKTPRLWIPDEEVQRKCLRVGSG